MEKTTVKANPMLELMNRKIEAKKSGKSSGFFSQFQPTQSRNSKKSPVGPSRGGRKGN